MVRQNPNSSLSPRHPEYEEPARELTEAEQEELEQYLYAQQEYDLHS